MITSVSGTMMTSREKASFISLISPSHTRCVS